jgi:hypothetical protein
MKIRLALLACVLAVTALAADVTGKWTGEQQTRNGAQTVTLTLKADGETLTGTMNGGRGGDAEISDGKISGDKVSFSLTREFNGNSMTIKYSGTVSGDEMKLTVETGRGSRELTLKRST